MKRIRCELTTQAPVLISANAGSTFAMETLPHIPGRSLLGAFASMFIKHYPEPGAHKNPVFSSWFLKGNLKFSQAVPLILRDKENPSGNKAAPPVRLAVAGERIPFCIRIKKKDNTLVNIFETSCPEKSRTLDRFAIKIAGPEPGETILKADETTTRITLHHARDREKGSAVEGGFFAYESINPGIQFFFDISGEKTDLISFIKEFSLSGNGQGIKISLGKSRTAEYGACCVKLMTSVPENITLDQDLEKAISDQAPIIGVLNSPAIILNEYGLPSTNLGALEKALDLKICKNKPFAILKQEINEKFTAVWGFKTPSELAFSGGSCFKIDTAHQSRATLRDRILRLVTHGLGEKTHEGFGSISFIPLDKYKHTTGLAPRSTPFTIKVAKPNCSPPDILKKIITNIYITHLTDQVTTMALMDNSAFFNGNNHGAPIPPSLCSRLETLAMNSGLENELKFFENDKDKTKAVMSLKGFYNGKTNLLAHLLEKTKILGNIDRQLADANDQTCLANDLASCGLEVETIDMDILEIL